MSALIWIVIAVAVIAVIVLTLWLLGGRRETMSSRRHGEMTTNRYPGPHGGPNMPGGPTSFG